MVSMTIRLDERLADLLREMAESQQRSQEELVVEAVSLYATRPGGKLPKGIGAHRSGRSDVSANARAILRQEARSGEWQ